MNIDDIADRATRQDTPGEVFHSEWLSDLPEAQWPVYIQFVIILFLHSTDNGHSHFDSFSRREVSY